MWSEYLGDNWNRTDETVRANALPKEKFCPPSKSDAGVKASASAPNVPSMEGAVYHDIEGGYKRAGQ